MNHVAPLLKVRDVRRPNVQKPSLPLVDLDFCIARFNGSCVISEYSDDENDKWVGCSRCYAWTHTCCLGLNHGDIQYLDFYCCSPLHQIENHNIFDWVSADGEKINVTLIDILSARPQHGLTNGIIDFCLGYCKENVVDNNILAILPTFVVESVRRHDTSSDAKCSLTNTYKMEHWPDKLLLPFHCSYWHWVAVEVDVVEKKAFVLDSLESKKSIEEVIPVVKRLLQTIGKSDAIDFCYKQGPIQENTVDCGCFVLYNLLQLAQQKPLQIDELKIGMKIRKFLLSLCYSKGMTDVKYPF